MPLRLLFSLLLSATAAGAQSLPARRLVQETRAAYDKVWPLALQPVQRWCVEAAAAGCEFKGPGVRATPDGGLLAADPMGPIRLFDATGRFVRELGRKGRGPGEYGLVIDAHVASDGFVTWFDNTQMRLATVRVDGRAGPVRRVLPPPSIANLYVVDTQLVVFDVPPRATLGTMVDATYHTVPVRGRPRTIARVRTPSLFAPGSNMFLPPGPFAARVLGDVSPRFDVAHTNGDRAAIDLFPSRGVPWHLDLDLPARPVLAIEKDSARAAALSRFRVKRLRDLPPPVRASHETLPAHHAPLQQLKLLADGTLWICPTPPRGVSLVRWDVFTVDGARVGYAMLPPSARVVDGARDWILVVERDADDVPFITRYRVIAQVGSRSMPARPAAPRR